MDIWMDVDTGLSEVPVNLMPLLDDTDFKSRETTVAYNATGMDLVWNFVTTGGSFTQTAVTPTTGGDYDWTHQGDGIYTIEIPASGGASINNDTEGFGWFSGVATGVLPWRGPVIGFRAAALNNALVDGATLDVNVTAMAAGVVTASAIAADAIGASELASDAVAEIADAIWDEARSGHVTDGSFGQAFQVVDSGTAQGGGTNTITLRAAYSSGDDRINGCLVFILSGTGAGQGNTANDYNNTTKVLTCDNNWSVTPDNTSVYILYPGSVGATTTGVADAVWDEARSSHTSSGSFGEGVNVTAISGDTTAADNAESFFDGTGYAGTGNVIPTVTTVTTVTNLTNAPTSGDLTATMKASVNAEVDTALSDYGALKPTTAGRTLDVTATGEAGIDWANIGSPTTTVGLSGTTVKTATDVETDTADIQSRLPAALTAGGNIKADALAISGDATAADNLEAMLDGTGSVTLTTAIVGNITGNLSGSVGSVTGAVGSVTGAVGSVTANVSADVVKISGDATAADNAESFFDGTGYAGTNNVIPTVTTLTNKTGFSLANPAGLQANTAFTNFEFLMVDSADGRTPKTGLTVTATRSIDGGAFASCANSATEVGGGVYKIDLDAADLNGTCITFKFTATGADQTTITVVTEP